MDIPIGDAIKHIPFIILGIWPVNLLTLWAQGHAWGWAETPETIMGLWEWGLFCSLSMAILIELGVKMFIALGERRRRIERAREEGRKAGLDEGRKAGFDEARQEGFDEARQEGFDEARKAARQEAREMLLVLNAAARANPDLLPALLQEYQEKYQNGSAAS